MPIIDFSHLSSEQRLDLIGELWDSIEADALPVSPALAIELDRRLATLDEDATHARSAADVLSDFKARYR